MALGLAFPFLALALSPQVAKALPKPGAWMMHFKQFLGFPMAGTVIWMLWSLSSHIENTTLFMVLGCLVSMGLGAWIYGLGQSKLKWSGLILIGLTLVYAVTLIQPKSKAASLTWVPYSERTLSESRTSGRPVFVDFGAEWCATCKFNELRVLNTPEIQAYFKTHQFILIKADWTQNDPEITAALAQYNRNAVPLYLYFPPGKPAKVLPELLKKQDILLLRPRR
jgi:thiol:disulfide interchange protein DsbD